MMSSEVIRRYNSPIWKGCCDQGAGILACAEGDNALCGDRVSVSLRIEGDGLDARIEQARFEGFGCSLCIASADVFAEMVEGGTVARALSLGFDDVCATLGGIQVNRARRECVGMPVHAFKTALEKSMEGQS